MIIDQTILRREEDASLRLRALYQSYGYTTFKMSKFEEYDLYVRNKDFLTAERAITFTDTDGKLLALKPDVTLSIIKNSRDTDSMTHKVCYNENVYRICESTHAWREIPQVGLECLGTIDLYQKSEVLYLAAKSLDILSSEYLMDISHIGMLQGALALIGDDKALQDSLLGAVSEKNADAVRKMQEQGKIDARTADTFISLLSCDGMLCDVLPRLDALCVNDTMRQAVRELGELADILAQEDDIISHLRLDFSVVNSMNYYSGLLFQGFVQGIPESVLSGGQYDKLMRKMGRRADAIGFAVYPDLLQRLPDNTKRAYDADVLLLYGADDSPAALHRVVRKLTEGGESVRCAPAVPEKMTFGRVLKLKDVKE
ncbi:MAG: ATP phosphoribosyltransferase regulatory subunit [Clostridia bacterium]|nr:ATP phosphoribosyltransferase regulatory subunit [Clostridia bacterium]